MSDPIIEAAQRAWAERYEKYYSSEPAPPLNGPVGQLLIAAAREMAKPIREHIEKIPAGLDATDLYDELDLIYRRLLGGHCEECRND